MIRTKTMAQAFEAAVVTGDEVMLVDDAEEPTLRMHKDALDEKLAEIRPTLPSMRVSDKVES